MPDVRPVSEIRIDKWLWAARFFKTRALATRACELGRIAQSEQRVKPSRAVKIGDFFEIKNDSATFTVEVLQLSDMRGPASVAQTLYRETDDSKRVRQQAIEERKLMPALERLTEGRPSKRDRRHLNQLRGRQS